MRLSPQQRFHWLPGSVLLAIPWWVCSLLGHRRVSSGRYDRSTLMCLFQAWRKKPTIDNLLAYLKFRRDLGYAVPSRFKAQLLVGMNQLGHVGRRRMVNLLQEKWPDILADLPTEQLLPFKTESPPVAAELQARGVACSGDTTALAQMHSSQEKWRAEFVQFLQDRRSSICIVGNAASLEGAGVGEKIDRHEVVFRFNHFYPDLHNAIPPEQEGGERGEGLQLIRDIGERLDVWVRVPVLPMPGPTILNAPDWVIISGPDARYSTDRWQGIVPLLKAGTKVLTFPIQTWAGLVRELQAPPSAGVLTLGWVEEIVGHPRDVCVAGFQTRKTKSMRYHHVLRHHKPGKRHNWQAERRLLRRYESEGFAFLD